MIAPAPSPAAPERQPDMIILAVAAARPELLREYLELERRQLIARLKMIERLLAVASKEN